MKTHWLTAVAVCSMLWPATARAASVKVESGLVQGVAAADLTVYKGLPFAAPPVSDLRWREPQPAARWTGVRTADRYAPGCLPSMGDPPQAARARTACT